MPGSKFESQGSSGSANQRAYQRHIINLRGECCYQGQVCSIVEIRDFCLGGMYLVHTEVDESMDRLVMLPSQGEIIEVNFALPTNPDERLQIMGRVVRADLKSLGVAFVQPNATTLDKVTQYATHYQMQLQTNLQNHAAGVEGQADYQFMLNEIGAMAMPPIQALVGNYLQTQSDVLLEMADKSLDIGEQNSYFSALETFKRQAVQFKAAFVDNMRHIIEAKPEPIRDHGLSLSDDQGLHHALSLVDDDEIDDWIARSDITDKAEAAYLDELVGIEQRLSVLLGMSIQKQNNPLGPESFSKAFQEALKGLNLSKAAYLLCCKIFRDVLKDGLGDLYHDINEYLIQHQVLPELHYEIKVHEDAGKRRKSRTDVEHARDFLDTLDDDSNNLYDLISNLQSIKRDRTDTDRTPRPRISTDQLLGKLTELAQLPELATQTQDSGDGKQSLSLRLLSQLEGSEDMQLGTREASIMEATGSIYEALYKDDIITSGVKDWLQGVELPLLQEAIRDESVLADKSHIARAFINHLRL